MYKTKGHRGVLHIFLVKLTLAFEESFKYKVQASFYRI